VQNSSPDALVSVIVRTMGRPELARALACIEAQSYRPIEVVRIDAAARKLGRSQAANAGLAEAKGRWAIFLDEDDEIEAHHVSDLVATIQRENDARVAYSQTRLLDESGRITRLLGGPFDHAALMRSNYLAIHAVLFDMSLVARGCRFDESLPMLEDWDFWLQLAARTRFAFTGKPTAIYHASAGQSGAGSAANLDREAVLAARERLMRKWQVW